LKRPEIAPFSAALTLAAVASRPDHGDSIRDRRIGTDRGDRLTKRELTCDDCYFRQESLCALLVPVPCPTFRLAARGQLAPPRQPRLVLRDAGRAAQPGPAQGLVLGGALAT
jgi:hypothetical protein